MNTKFQSTKMNTKSRFFCASVVVASIGVIAFLIWVGPQINVYRKTMAGKAALMQAESDRKIKIYEAKAKQESAEYEKQAEITRAQGIAEANRIIGNSLNNNPRYLDYLYIEGIKEGSEKGNKTVFVPTFGQPGSGFPAPIFRIDDK